MKVAALRFALRSSNVRAAQGQFTQKYADLGYGSGPKYDYMMEDVGPSMAPWHTLPTATRPNPYGDMADSYHFEMYPRKDMHMWEYTKEQWDYQRKFQSRYTRALGNLIFGIALLFSIKIASVVGLGPHDHHDHDAEVIECPNRF